MKLEGAIKIGLIILAIFVGTYVARTVIDIGCASYSGRSSDSQRRSFLGLNCWNWERTKTVQMNYN